MNTSDGCEHISRWDGCIPTTSTCILEIERISVLLDAFQEHLHMVNTPDRYDHVRVLGEHISTTSSSHEHVG
jgi:hypothetical protein